jgi:dTDP-4-amino-4,6-dideoxygalactose transaminase
MGDGGAVVTDDGDLAATVRSLRHHGAPPTTPMSMSDPGRTERLDNLQAALLRLKLRRLDSDNDERRSVARRYRERLTGLPLRVPAEDDPSDRSVHHLFVVEVDDRDRVRGELAALGVSTGVHYPTPVHLQPGWRHLGYAPGSLPVSERLADRILSLPVFPGMREGEVDRVVEALASVLR